MSKREIAALACKILSLYALIAAVGTSTEVFQVIAQIGSSLLVSGSAMSTRSLAGLFYAQSMWRLGMLLFPCAIQIMLAIGLWMIAGFLAERMVHEFPDDPPLDIHSLDIKGIVFASFGLFQLVQALPTLLYALLASVWNALSWSGSMLEYGRYYWPDIFRALLGLCLLLQGRGIVGLIHSLQNMGKPESATESTSS